MIVVATKRETKYCLETRPQHLHDSIFDSTNVSTESLVQNDHVIFGTVISRSS